jgi:hypothetical protein
MILEIEENAIRNEEVLVKIIIVSRKKIGIQKGFWSRYSIGVLNILPDDWSDNKTHIRVYEV